MCVGGVSLHYSGLIHDVLRLYHGVKSISIQWKLFFEFSLLVFSWAHNIQYSTPEMLGCGSKLLL